MRRLRRGIKTGEFIKDAYAFIKWFFAPPFSNKGDQSHYYGKDKWPVFDFENASELKTVPVRTADNKIVLGV